MHLSEFNQGDIVKLSSFGQTCLDYRSKLLALGITCGVPLKIIRKAPLGCPIQIEIRGTSVSLRKNEINALEWQSV